MKIKKSQEEKFEDLKNQVGNYNTLGITQSRRGQVVLVFCGLYLFSFIFSFLGLVQLNDLLWGLIIYIPILFFVYKGHRWAMISLIILWCIEKVYTAYISIENGGGILSSIIWLIIIFSVINRALRVENERRKILLPVSIQNDKYCVKCGSKQKKENKFCSSCGTNIV